MRHGHYATLLPTPTTSLLQYTLRLCLVPTTARLCHILPAWRVLQHFCLSPVSPAFYSLGDRFHLFCLSSHFTHLPTCLPPTLPSHLTTTSPLQPGLYRTPTGEEEGGGGYFPYLHK